ncbi:hypothetical protein HK104_002365 [Borealophlyctis nickersoniae]|nr:hypothetical protein HK104_002365 [Borealophlyctis nickersoniae]
MVLGVLLGVYVPSVQSVLDATKIADVSLPVAIGLLAMMYPVFCKVRYERLADIFRTPGVVRNILVSLAVNWVAAPLIMTALAWATLPDLPGFRSGVMLVGVARCIAMVLIWNQLADGDVEWCAVLVALNSVLQVLLYSPFAYFYAVIIGKGPAINVNMWLVTRSVLIFLGIPLLAGLMTRIVLRWALRRWLPRGWYDKAFLNFIGPLALLGLLYTIVVMFALQGRQMVHQIGNVFRVAVPLTLYFFIVFTLTFLLCRHLRIPYATAATQSFTAASNNFELAIAVAVATYGINSEQALATVVGPLVEVPVLLGLVYLSLWFRKFYPVFDATGVVRHEEIQVGVGGGAEESRATVVGDAKGTAPSDIYNLFVT